MQISAEMSAAGGNEQAVTFLGGGGRLATDRFPQRAEGELRPAQRCLQRCTLFAQASALCTQTIDIVDACFCSFV